MKSNPVADVIHFLLQPAWTTGVYWLLMLGSLGIAIYAFSTFENQRSLHRVGNWIFRFLIGSMWWQQTLWKLPPTYGVEPSKAFGATGLAYWMKEMGKSAAIQIQADFVSHTVLPNFYYFAPVVYSLEVLTAVSLILGIFVRFWGVIGALQILNLWLGLYNAQGEWPWTYFFLIVLQLIFALNQYGRSLGIDAIIACRPGAGKPRRALGRFLLNAVT